MYKHTLTQPIIKDVIRSERFSLSLSKDISDLLVLSAVSNSLFELIVADINGPEAHLLLRCQPFINVDFHSEVSTDVVSTHSLSRTVGQGVRCYSLLSTEPRLIIESLREGISLVVNVDQHVEFALGDKTKFELVSLENDLRVLHEHNVLVTARRILSTKINFEDSIDILTIQISEIEQVRRDIRHYINGDKDDIHSGIASELLKIDVLLQNKSQWLLRTYNQKLERPSWARASNEQLTSIEQLQRKLDCYELLAPKEVSDMVVRLSEDDY